MVWEQETDPGVFLHYVLPYTIFILSSAHVLIKHTVVCTGVSAVSQRLTDSAKLREMEDVSNLPSQHISISFTPDPSHISILFAIQNVLWCIHSTYCTPLQGVWILFHMPTTYLYIILGPPSIRFNRLALQ